MHQNRQHSADSVNKQFHTSSATKISTKTAPRTSCHGFPQPSDSCRCNVQVPSTFVHILYVLAGLCSFLTCEHNDVTCSFYLPHTSCFILPPEERSCRFISLSVLQGLTALIVQESSELFSFSIWAGRLSMCAI